MRKHPNVYIGDTAEVKWRPDTDPDDDREPTTVPQEVVQILGFNPMEGDMAKSEVALVVLPEELDKVEKAMGKQHPAKLSKVGATATTNNPSNHTERMKFARMFAEMCGASKPEDEGAHQPPTQDHKGREAGQKKPHDIGSTKVGGMGSRADNNFGVKVRKPSEIGASPYKDPASGGKVKKPRG